MTARRCFYIQKTLLQNNKKTVVRLANVFDITSCFRLSLPWGGRLNTLLIKYVCYDISIHALRGEGDPRAMFLPIWSRNFNPRPPWGGRRGQSRECALRPAISIHALRVEGDLCRRISSKVGGISIHALRGEGDSFCFELSIHRIAFQSTPSVWRATALSGLRSMTRGHFNPRPPWGGRPFRHRPPPARGAISIHALRGEGDVGQPFRRQGRTKISIHALRGEGDGLRSFSF